MPKIPEEYKRKLKGNCAACEGTGQHYKTKTPCVSCRGTGNKLSYNPMFGPGYGLEKKT